MRTKHILLSIAVLLLSLGLNAAEPKQYTIKDQGIERLYYLYLPDDIKDNAPLVIVMHGYGGRAMKGGQNLMQLADKEGFAVCYPQGSQDKKGKNCWNVGYPFQADMKVDDVKFLRRLAAHLQKTHGLSKANTFATGMSNGGEMSYLLAFTSPDVFAAVAPIAGLTMKWMYDELTPKRHIPLMEVHGTVDKTSRWNGDLANEGGWGEYIAVPQAVNLWAAEARCNHEITEVFPLVRNEVVLHRYVDGKPAWKGGPATEVWLYEVKGGGHSWAEADFDTCSEIWRFFSQYLRD